MEIQNIYASIEGKEILKGVNLTVKPGEIHAVMGPNGSGKSTLASVLLGHPQYQISNNKYQIPTIKIGNRNIISLPTEERAKAGLFLAFQSPVTIPGVSVINLLRSAYQTVHGKKVSDKAGKAIQNPVLARRLINVNLNMSEFMSMVKEHARFLNLDQSFLSRGIHDGFSGGEKKKVEMLQALVLGPKFAIFDEIDTGLDVDALQMVARGMDRLAKLGTGIIVITHYQRILRYVKPQFVHVFIAGRIVKSGNAALAKHIEKNGYQEYEESGSAKVSAFD